MVLYHRQKPFHANFNENIVYLTSNDGEVLEKRICNVSNNVIDAWNALYGFVEILEDYDIEDINIITECPRIRYELTGVLNRGANYVEAKLFIRELERRGITVVGAFYIDEYNRVEDLLESTLH